MVYHNLSAWQATFYLDVTFELTLFIFFIMRRLAVFQWFHYRLLVDTSDWKWERDSYQKLLNLLTQWTRQ